MRSESRTSCENAWRYHLSLPVLPSRTTSESVYRFAPGRSAAFGFFAELGQSPGFATPRYTSPFASTAGGYQRPPPLYEPVLGVGTVSNDQRVLPVAASSE